MLPVTPTVESDKAGGSSARRSSLARGVVPAGLLVVCGAVPWVLSSPEPPPGGAPDCDRSPSFGCLYLFEGGRFAMGSDPASDPQAAPDESPAHEVELSPFWLHQFEVFASSYEECVRAGGCDAREVRSGGLFVYGDPRRAGRPVNGITWAGADAYCRWKGLRLPTEAEWEFAARDGVGARWINSPDEPPDCPQAVIRGGCGTGGAISMPDPIGRTPVGALAGNLWEWTADWYAPDYYAHAPRRDPTGPASGTARVQRGGGWATEDPAELRSAHRASLDPTLQLDDVGFRCAATATTRFGRLSGR